MARLAWLAVFLVACSGNGDDAFDAPLADAASPDGRDLQACIAIRAEWRARVAQLSRSCDAPADCVALGGVTDSGCSSDRILLADLPLLECSGVAVNAAAAAAIESELGALSDAFYSCLGGTRCSQVGLNECTFDCKAGGTPVCNAAHQCAVQSQSSCPPIFRDAGVSDAT